MKWIYQSHDAVAIKNRSVWVLKVVYLFLSLAILPNLSQAQALPITASGLSTKVNVTGSTNVTQYDITGGTRTGTNLFHSFGDFNIPAHNVANFLNGVSFDVNGSPLPPGLPTENILARVTGQSPSIIFGTMQTTGFHNANLFLMNPSGILFGPGASLNVGGSVTFTTADYVRLTDGVRFNAVVSAAADALLSSSPVAAYGFLGTSPSGIVLQGSLFMRPEGTSVSLVAGDITIQSDKPESGTAQPAILSAPGGQIGLASTASRGEFVAKTLAPFPNNSGQSFGTLGTVKVSQESILDVSGNGGGTVLIRGGTFVIDSASISANTTGPGRITNGVESIGGGIDIAVEKDMRIQNGATLQTNMTKNATPDVQYGGVVLKADRLEILGSQVFEDPSTTGIFSAVARGTTGGSAGDIKLESNSILVRDFGNGATFLETSTLGAGKASNIAIRSLGNLELDGPITIDSIASSTGRAGNIQLSSFQGNILMTNGPFISSLSGRDSSGKVGSITLTAKDGEILLSGTIDEPGTLFTHIDGEGANTGEGGIQIITKNLTIENSGIQIDNFTPHKPGDLTLVLTGRLSMTSNAGTSSTLLTTTRREAQSADLSISAPNILLTGKSLISTETYRNGDGGTLNIFADNLDLTRESQITSSSRFNPSPPPGSPETPSGTGGTITVRGLDKNFAKSVHVDGNGSGFFSNSEGEGPAGNIVVNANLVAIENGGKISAETTGTSSKATGGSIIVNATDHVTMTSGASITANSKGPADAGKININAGQQLDLVDNSSITTTTESAQANGGDIDIRAVERVRLVHSRISTSVNGAEGSGGNIFIDPKVVVIQDSDVTARAIGGSGGNITFVTPLFLQDSASTVSATSQRGASGTVTIQSPTSNLSGTVGQLASKTSPPQVLLQNRCVALAGGEQSTFLLTGRDTLPGEPSGWLSSPVMMEHWTGEEIAHASRLMGRNREVGSSSDMTVQNNNPLAFSLRRLTPPGFLVRSFATGTTGCPS